MTSPEWDIEPGTELSRTERMRRFGGSRMSGIAPSATTPNVFIYSDPAAGEEFGYNFDGWDPAREVFSYTGEGQVGDQQFIRGNAAIRDHADAGKALRLFLADGIQPGSGEVIQRYAGQFELDAEHPYRLESAPDINRDMRQVIVFHLRPVAETNAAVDVIKADMREILLGEMPTGDASIIAQLDTIRPDMQGGKRVPYQYIVLLWAISEARRGRPRLRQFSDASGTLRRLLEPFGRRKSPPDPIMPWFALRNIPSWWELVRPDQLPPEALVRHHVRSYDIPAGLNRERYDRIKNDERYARWAVDYLSTYIDDSPEYRSLMAELGLSELVAFGQQGEHVLEVALENNVAKEFVVTHDAEPTRNKRAEAELQDEFVAMLRSDGHTLCRNAIPVDGTILLTDIFVKDQNELIEVKARSDRPTVREALGQILDYAHHISPPVRTKTILVPIKPRPSMLDVLHEHGVRAVWRGTDDGTFEYSR